MVRRPPRSTLDRSSAASDVYKRQVKEHGAQSFRFIPLKEMGSDCLTLVIDKKVGQMIHERVVEDWK